ncbi:MAG: outer membrane lipoprotein carrier protein LolA [Polyangiales bacterium]
MTVAIDRRALLRSLVAVPLFAARSVHAAAVSPDGALDAALADIAKAREKLTTLQGPFTQERMVSLLATKVISTGRISLVRPDRLRWELAPPDAATYWVLPDALAYATKSGSGKIGKASQGPLGGVLQDLLVILGGDLALLKGRYALTLVKRDAAGIVVHAAPLDAALAKTTKRVEMTTGADAAALQRIAIVEAGGDKSDITFGALVRNAAIDAKLVAGP